MHEATGGRGRRPRCRRERRLPGGWASRFACVAGGSRYRVDWQHYGTGRYVIQVLEGGRWRELSRGTLSIGE